MPDKPPPPKPKGAPDDLHEVERALSVLQGRHPEHERSRREDEEKRARRAAAADTQARRESTATRSRNIRLAAIGLPVVFLVVFIGLLVRRELNRRDHVEQAAAPFRALGFTTIETSSPSATGSLEATVEPGCIVALSSVDAPIKVTRGANSTEGAGPVLFCTCASEKVGLSSTVPSDGGLVLMRADAATIGGTRAFSFAPFKVGSSFRADEACGEVSLDAWLDAKHAPAPPTTGPWLESWPRRAPLVADGFKVTGVAPAGAPFVVIDLPKESCLLATSSLPDDKLSLRAKGGAMAVPEAAGSFARCAQAEDLVLVAREGGGELVVLVGPAGTIGGMKGLREIARESGITLAQSVVPAADRPWDAKQTLLASQVPDVLITVGAAPDVAAQPDARVAALSFETPNALAPDSPPDFFSYCEPALDPGMHEAICVFSGPQKWRTEGAEAIGGIARSKLPFWLYTMQAANDPLALKGMTQLFALARKLRRDGFAPTTLEALTELPTGVEVLGRTGEDAVVAVGVAAMLPWVYTLSDDGTAWSLDGPPRIVPVKPLEKVMLTTTMKNLPPKASRRTVVFRRLKK